ncbi:peritrophin-44-like [Musca autumnalis]|uniref:peritrophin-44-like n=1 Tax=Musca autumnalis TaxID=221902 RepID=UPI003CEB0D8D
MKEYKILWLMFACTLAVQMQFTLAAYTMSETCMFYHEGYIADPDSVNGYGYCRGGELIAAGSCLGEFVYNPRTAQCDHADNVDGGVKHGNSCNADEASSYVADPDDCSRACYCDNGTYSCVSCPTYQVFNPSLKACVYMAEYQCPQVSICRLIPNGKWVADPDKCGNYLTCLEGNGVSTSCPDGLYYSQSTNSCTPTNVCAPVTEPPETITLGPGVFIPLPNSPTACAVNPISSSDDDPFFVEDGHTCMGYYSCERIGSYGIWNKCPVSTHFDQSQQACVTPFTVKCRHDRCGNLNQSFVSALGCTDYYYCLYETEQEGMDRSCASINPNYPYFNEQRGACVNQIPDFAICNKY